ncbi:hypothetical protein FHR83_008228 [Actinoplanes campanulatus]|uniref:Uncharacterized protein n=1 Tax=Actinoplanes campanulatus TaxID=113559 RepID=A0A7W5AQJ6_9ACTN|nr:hypothetical protein [Actinoplanes campanulatus]MBB3100506.1 hypothetical protein [Actinoplanes campanulatus]
MFGEQHHTTPDLVPRTKPPSARQVASWIYGHLDNLDGVDVGGLDRCPNLANTASLATTLTGLQSASLKGWITTAPQTGLPGIRDHRLRHRPGPAVQSWAR